MNHIAIRLVVALFSFLVGISAVAILTPLRSSGVSGGGAEREILQIERQYIQANLNGDTATLNNILADEFTIRGRWGRAMNKAQKLALLENPDLDIEAIRTDNVLIEVNGDHAVVTGEAFVQSRYGDREAVGAAYRFTRRYEKRDGRWQIVSVQVRR